MTRLLRPSDRFVKRIAKQLAHLSKQEIPMALNSLPALSGEQIATLFEVAFWASLRSEEGRATRVFISVRRPGDVQDANAFARPVPFCEEQIAKLAPAVPPAGSLLVYPVEDVWLIWGFSRSREYGLLETITLELSDPGAVRIRIGPMSAYGVFDGRFNPIFGGTTVELANILHRVLKKVLPTGDSVEIQAVWREALALRDLANTVLRQGRGGTVLVVPGETGAWEPYLNPFNFRFQTPDTTVRSAIRTGLEDSLESAELQQRIASAPIPDELRQEIVRALKGTPMKEWLGAVRALASLAAVDGAIVLTRDMRVLGFGAKIGTMESPDPSLFIDRFEPGRRPIKLSALKDAGGTRHQSAVRFVGATKDCVALVASQDRHLSLIYWDASLDSVGMLRNFERWL